MKQICVMLVALLFAGSNTWADGMPTAAGNGPVILTVSAGAGGNQTVQFSLEDLQALESRSYRVQHDWSNTPHTYHGPLLSAVLRKAGIEGGTYRLTALNEYFIDLEAPFVDRYQPILAWQEDGRKMRVRNKGPLWLMTPLHMYPELSEPKNVSRLIWQLSDIKVQ